jgi:glutathione S-transferase
MDALTLVIGNKTYSSWSLRPWLLLKHLGVPFREIVVPLYEPQSRERILAYSPSGKVPALIDGSMTIWESLAICEHVAERHPQAWPRDSESRALARSAATEMHAGFVALRTELPMNCRERRSGVVPSAAARADIERILELWASCRQSSKSKGPWLFGEFGIADAMFAPVASRFHTYGVTLPTDAERYVVTVLGDAAVREWITSARNERERIPGAERGQPCD